MAPETDHDSSIIVVCALHSTGELGAFSIVIFTEPLAGTLVVVRRVVGVAGAVVTVVELAAAVLAVDAAVELEDDEVVLDDFECPPLQAARARARPASANMRSIRRS